VPAAAELPRYTAKIYHLSVVLNLSSNYQLWLLCLISCHTTAVLENFSVGLGKVGSDFIPYFASLSF
jgi:hypothetical protein